MTDKTDSKEREPTYLCQAWGETDLPSAAIVQGLDAVREFLVEQWLGDADQEHDDGTKALPAAMADMQEQWALEGEAWKWSISFEIGGISVQRVDDVGRASLAASAGSEPVAEVVRNTAEDAQFSPRSAWPLNNFHDLPLGTKLYTHPSPPEGMVGGWIALPGTLPEPGVPVLLDIGKKYPIRAMWAAKHTVEAADDDTDWGEYDEATETYYCPEGWYEWNEHEDTNWAVSATPRAWAPLPPTSSADSRKGE